MGGLSGDSHNFFNLNSSLFHLKEPSRGLHSIATFQEVLVFLTFECVFLCLNKAGLSPVLKSQR